MAWATLVAWLVWSATVFALRNALHVRKTGRSAIFVRGSSGPGLRARVPAAAQMLALALVPVAIAGEWLGVPHLWPDTNSTRVAAGVVYLVGLIGTYACQGAMHRSWRIGIDPLERTALVTGGPFRFVRNPIYVFVVVSATSLALAIPSVLALAVPLLAAIGLALQVRWIEEPHLVASHGDEYLRWAARTGRFLPGIGKLRRPGTDY
jgi:protein-S-isoprenylcysteine O-methyltransferase Ste14